MNIELWKLIIIAIIGVIGYLLRESYKKAQVKKQIAVKLKVLTSENWRNILDADNISDIIRIGILWHLEEKDIQYIDDYQQIQDKYKLQIKEISELLKENQDVKMNLQKYYLEVQNMPEKLFEYQCDKYKQYISNLQENRDFISNEEASLLSMHALAKVVIVRSHLESVLMHLLSFTVTARYVKSYDDNHLSADFINLIISMIKVGREMPKLVEIANSINKKKIFDLMVDDFLELK